MQIMQQLGYNQKQDEENGILNDYEGILNNYVGNYRIGAEVTIGAETFYVIENSNSRQEKILLLAKECIDTTTYKQSASANKIAFSSTNYWSSDFTSAPYDLIETGIPDTNHYAAYAAYMYAQEFKELDPNVTGRLMTYSEFFTIRNFSMDIAYGVTSTKGHLRYWLGCADSTTYVWCTADEGAGLGTESFDSSSLCGVRPVIEISKDALS